VIAYKGQVSHERVGGRVEEPGETGAKPRVDKKLK